MNIFEASVLGIVEGLTEFLPISSTGHLILAGHLMGQHGTVADTFEIFIQLGAILAVVFLYHQRFAMLFKPGDGQRFMGLKGWGMLAVTSLPALIVGFIAHDAIKSYLFNTTTVAWALGIGGLAILIIERMRLKTDTASLDTLTMRQALMIGVFQCLALWPGVSRAGATIIGGLFSGLNRQVAAEYSFIAAVPIMCVATLYDLLKNLKHLGSQDLLIFAVGFVVAFLSAILAIKGFIHLLQRTTLTPFGVYRIVIAIVFLWIIQLP